MVPQTFFCTVEFVDDPDMYEEDCEDDDDVERDFDVPEADAWEGEPYSLECASPKYAL